MTTEEPETQAYAESDVALAEAFQAKCVELKQQIHQIIVGQDVVIEHLLTTLFARGHALLIGVPGLAKTLLVKTLASTLGWEFRRIQFTPDLMPSDITGLEILQTDNLDGHREFKFVRGPIFANLVLADEINRTPPKTQAALLEAMQEYSVTVAGRTMSLSQPFAVVATQNPIEQEGTYPLPEAQLDRFMFSIPVDYPGKEEEMRVVDETTSRDFPTVESTFSREEVVQLQALVRRVPVSRHLLDYAVSLVRASRPAAPEAIDTVKQYVEWGAGPRASQYLVLAAKVLALIRGQAAPSAEEIRSAAQPVLRHRVIPNYNATGEGVTSEQIVDQLVASVQEPSYGNAPD